MSSHTNEKRSLKIWNTFEQQLNILQSRGLVIEDFERSKHYLSCIGYYRLSGYWYPFRLPISHKKRDDFFVENTCFNDVLNIYQFDKKLRLICLDALERIEMAIRTEVAYLLGRSDPQAHLYGKFLDGDFTRYDKRLGKSKHEIWLEHYHQQIKRSKKQALIQHHLQYYNGIPIWVAVEVIDFGSISILYSGLKYKHRQQIAEKYETSEDVFTSWIHSLNIVRNICAHHSRLWNTNIPKPAKKSKDIKPWHDLDRRKIFFYLCLMKHFLSIINPRATWDKRVELLLLNFPIVANEAISEEDMGLKSWEDWNL